MYCPKCSSHSIHRVTYRVSPLDSNVKIRKFECLDCGFRFSTKEVITEDEGWDRLAYKNRMELKEDKNDKS